MSISKKIKSPHVIASQFTSSKFEKRQSPACHPELVSGSSPVIHSEVERQQSSMLAKLSDFLQTKTFKVIYFGGLTLIAFQYLFITRFPIGDDPAIHIANAKFTAYSSLFTRNYPIPVSIFKALGQITHIDYVILFCIVICVFFLVSALSFFKFSRLLGSNYILPFTATLVFIGGRWTNDSLRMGLLAEVFAWSILFGTFYYLVKEKLIPLLIFTILLLFSHPLVFMVYFFVFLFYFLIHLFTKSHTRVFLLKYAGFLVLLGLIVLLLKPDLIHKFLNFTNKDRIGWGERSLWEIFTTDSKRRLITPLLAIFGLIISAKRWKEPIIKIAYILTFVSLFLSLNYIFGIHFLPFRFYPYLEMAVALFAALGIEFVITTTFPKLRAPALAILLAAFIITLPNYYINDRYLVWQSRDPSAKAIMTPDDLTTINWIKHNTPTNKNIIAPTRYAVWIRAIGDHPATHSKIIYFIEKKHKNRTVNKANLYDYIVYPAEYPVPNWVSDYYYVIYESHGTRILQLPAPIN